MTRKDYILIAEALRKSLVYEVDFNGPDSDIASGIRFAASRIAYALSNDNPRFNQEHFLAVVRGEKDLNSHPAQCKHMPLTLISCRPFCVRCGKELDLR